MSLEKGASFDQSDQFLIFTFFLPIFFKFKLFWKKFKITVFSTLQKFHLREIIMV